MLATDDTQRVRFADASTAIAAGLQPPCNWTDGERAAEACDLSMTLFERRRALERIGVEYNEVAASHLVSRPSERDEIWAMPRVFTDAVEDSPPVDVVTVDEMFAGGAVLSRELRAHSASPDEGGIVFRQRGFIEKDSVDVRALRVAFPDVLVCENYYDRSWSTWPRADGIRVLLACPPCRIVASPGRQLMLKDPDAEVSTTALGELDAVHDYDYILGEQHENIATLEHGIVLITQDESLPRHDRINRIEGAPCDAELARGVGLPTTRGRLTFMYEKKTADLGPIRRLENLHSGGAIDDILDRCIPPDVLDTVLLDGVLTLVEHELPPRGRVTLAARLTWGTSGGTVRPGSKVYLLNSCEIKDERPFIVSQLFGSRAKLFYDSNKHPEYLRTLVEVCQLTTEPRVFDVLHTGGLYGSLTHFGTPPLYGQKQLILRGNRASLFTTTELYRLHGDLEHLDMLRGLSPAVDDVTIRAQVGKSLVRSLAAKTVDRLVERVQLAIDVKHGRLQPYSRRPEHVCLEHIAALESVGTALVIVDMTGAPKVLACDDDALICVNPERLVRKDAKNNATALAQHLLSEMLGFEPDAFLAGTTYVGNHAVVVTVCPIVADTRFVFDQIAWLDLSALRTRRASPVYHEAIKTCIANLRIEQGVFFHHPCLRSVQRAVET